MKTTSEARHSLAPGTYTPPVEPWLNIIFEDDQLLVLNKPSGLLSVPGRGAHLSDCIEARAKAHCADARIVHRLDMETSGLIVLAKTPKAQAHLGKQFERRNIQKRYVAVVWGHVHPKAGAVNAPLRCDWPNRPKQMVDPELGKHAVTHWQVLDAQDDTTRVALTPVTGRSHQLRVHMLSLGHPILGDRLYGTPASQSAAPRLLLHAEHVTLHHPADGGLVSFDVAAEF